MPSSSKSNDFQFRLRTLFLAITSVALVLAVGNWLGWKNLYWILAVFLNPWTLSGYLAAHAERSNLAVYEHRQQCLERLMAPEPDDED